MSLEVAIAVLGAALLHAIWHSLVKTSGDRIVSLAGMNVVSGTTALLFLPFVGLLSWTGFGVIAISVVLHAVYKIALARLYKHSDLSVAYPLARGLTPLIATALGAVLLGQWPNGHGLAGTILISVGLCALVSQKGSRAVTKLSVWLACCVGLSVASYSALDAYGIALTGDWLAYTAWLVALDSSAFIVYAFVTRGRAVAAIWHEAWRQTLVSGLLGTASFGIFLWALARAPVGPVSALRESSIVFAALIGMTFLRENVTAVRLWAIGIVLTGVAIIAIGR